MKAKKFLTFGLPAVLVIFIDQLSKYLVRTTPAYQNWDLIPGWLAFHYTLNPGMALGMDFLSTPVVSLISITATIGILGYVLYTLPQARLGYLFCMGLIMGGAFGNIIDRVILAKIQGYGGILDGHVVDFIHFTPVLYGYPVFPYIFNFADASISTAIIALLIFHKQIFPERRVDEEISGSNENEKVAGAENF